jgi:hypothetical protein
MTKKIVIARYSEDVSWAEQFDNVQIYNKGDVIENTRHHQTLLNNFGREAHTYLFHILDCYDELDDITCFLQGDFFVHTNEHFPEYKMYRENPNLVEDFDKAFFSNLDNGFSKTFLNYPIDHFEDDRVIDWFKTRIDTNGLVDLTNAKICWGACFSVTKEKIYSRSREYYLNLIQDAEVNQHFPWWAERSWYYILNDPEKFD